MNPNDVSERLVNLGQKRLLPKETLAPLTLIEGRVHSLVEDNTFPFLNGLAHFLPNSRLQEVTTKLDVMRKEFEQAREVFLKDYGQHRHAAQREWEEMAHKLSQDPAWLLEAIVESFPPVNKLERSFVFDVQLFQISLPQTLSREIVTVTQQQAVITARQQAAQQASVKMRSDLEQFIGDCVANLREQTATLCEEMLVSISNGKTDGVHQKTLNRLVNFIDQFKQMNFVGDDVMEQRLEQVRKELLGRSAEEYRGNQSAQQRLRSGLSALGSYARSLAKADATPLVQRFGELGKRKFALAA
ncbi:MAG: hypothetical protein HY912_24255 [Desulfomonile tiedjei]|uniref:DUF3150 domain-containing protein n=1 Tax=Desulfomonile tiedjei TaxID=2358 RepID=A0A9D6V5R7_9BACT|nr:hypothetical protein [Desulfomonile tiedjei]